MWYHYLKQQEGRKQWLLKDRTSGLVIIAKEERGSRLYRQINRLELEQQCSLSTNCYHEVILGEQAQKFKIDLDGDDVKDPIKVRNDVISTLYTVFENHGVDLSHSDLLIFQSVKSDSWYGKEVIPKSYSKMSYHIVVNNYYCATASIAKSIAKEIAEKSKYGNYIDLGVYKSIQLFRLSGCHKEGKKEVKQLLTSWSYNGEIVRRKIDKFSFNSTLISVISNCNPLSITIDIPERITTNEVCDESCIDVVHRFIGSDCYKIREIEGCFVFLDRLFPSHCPVCNREHQRNGARVHSYNGNIYFRCWSAERSVQVGLNCVVKPKTDDSLLELKRAYCLEGILSY